MQENSDRHFQPTHSVALLHHLDSHHRGAGLTQPDYSPKYWQLHIAHSQIDTFFLDIRCNLFRWWTEFNVEIALATQTWQEGRILEGKLIPIHSSYVNILFRASKTRGILALLGWRLTGLPYVISNNCIFFLHLKSTDCKAVLKINSTVRSYGRSAEW